MASKERILELARRLEKATNKTDASKVESILDSLQRIETISIALLKETDLGKKVNVLRKLESFKHESNIRTMAQSLVLKWKDQVNKERGLVNKKKKQKRLKLKNSNNNTNNNNNNNNKHKSVSPSTDNATKTEQNVKAELNNTDNGYNRDPFDWQTGDGRRDKMISQFISVLKPKPDKEEYACFMQIAAEIEQELGKTFGSESREYIQKYRDLHYNIKKNEDLKLSLLRSEVSTKQLVTMTSAEMAPEELKKRRDSERKWAMEEARSDHALDVSQAMTDEYKCGKCKQRKCKYSQAQTRSADEPMTTFVTCLVCGNRWKC